MGVTYVDGIVRGLNAATAPVRFLVDSGASYTVLPHDVWPAIGLVPKRTMSFSLAQPRAHERRHVEARVPVEHQLVVDDMVRQIRRHLTGGQLVAGHSARLEGEERFDSNRRLFGRQGLSGA